MAKTTVNTTLRAVLTGDIIASTELADAQMKRVRQTLIKCAESMQSEWRNSIYSVPRFFRGDAWQAVMKTPELALRASLYIRAKMISDLGVDTRISIAIGTVDKIDYHNISLSTGEAFTLSGRALDNTTLYFPLTGAVRKEVGPLGDWIQIALRLCGGLAGSWTRRQAEIVSYALLMKSATQEEIARSLPRKVAKQTVTEALKSANWRTIREAVDAFEETNWIELLRINWEKARELNWNGIPESGSDKAFDKLYRLSHLRQGN